MDTPKREAPGIAMTYMRFGGTSVPPSAMQVNMPNKNHCRDISFVSTRHAPATYICVTPTTAYGHRQPPPQSVCAAIPNPEKTQNPPAHTIAGGKFNVKAECHKVRNEIWPMGRQYELVHAVTHAIEQVQARRKHEFTGRKRMRIERRRHHKFRA